VTGPPGLVWLASFPKSGNTWFRVLLANLAAAGDAPADINDLDERGGIASNRGQFEAATLLDSGLLSPDDIDRLRPRLYQRIAAETHRTRWMKTHDAWTLNADGVPVLGRGAARAAIYLARDPRDVAVSLAHHNNSSLDEAITLINGPDSALCRSRSGQSPQLRQRLLSWSAHIESWLAQTDVPTRLVRYEDMRADPAAVFAEALAFAGVPASADDIARAVRHADFAEMRRQEAERGFVERTSKTAPFFRRGEVGGWRDDLTAAQTRRLEDAHAPMMARLGYPAASEPALSAGGAQATRPSWTA
jgi:hypothetical protein